MSFPVVKIVGDSATTIYATASSCTPPRRASLFHGLRRLRGSWRGGMACGGSLTATPTYSTEALTLSNESRKVCSTFGGETWSLSLRSERHPWARPRGVAALLDMRFHLYLQCLRWFRVQILRTPRRLENKLS